MSDIKDQTLAHIKEAAELENLKADTQAKKAVLDNKIISSRLEQVKQNEKDLEIAKKSSYGALSKEEIENTVKDNDEYMGAAQHPLTFICSTFNNMIPFFRKNLILIGAQTGEGKSTAVANIAYSSLINKNKETGKTLRTLVITNEEKREDFYNRVTSLAKGWHYTNHSKFTPEQRKEFNKMIPILSNGGRLTVIDDTHGGSHGVTTSIEGLETIFDSLIENKEYYDVVIIDYYQNIIHSKKNPSLTQYQVQERVSRALDKFKNLYPAPVVIMSQLKSSDGKEKIPFQFRIMGSKSIMVPATFASEMVIDRKNLRTKWVVHKSRYTEAIGKDFWTGYDKGRFVEYTNSFAEKVQKMHMEREAYKLNQKIDESNGLKDVFKKDENK